VFVAREIERKFLVVGEEWRRLSVRTLTIHQAYLARTTAATVRVRLVDDEDAYVSVKTARDGAIRGEYEYAIPASDAREMMSMRTGIIVKKKRHIVVVHDMQWEVDVFEGVHEGLVIAEIELPHAEAAFERPDWLGREVTHDHRYYNGYLATHFPVAAEATGTVG
jgi:adenylate cyclase